MAAIRNMALWRQLRVAPVALFLVAVALSLVRARDQPGLDVSLGGTSASVVPGDVALFALFVLAAAQLRHLRGSRLALASLIVLFAFLLGSAATNGATAFVSGAKLGELAVLTLGGLLVLRSDDRLEALVDVLLLFTLAADAVGVVKFITGGGGRQSSFLGEHDFAALATLPLLYGLTLVFERRRPHRAALAICAGAIGCTLGAALASLLGLYLGALALLVWTAVRGRLALRPVVVLVLTVAAVSAGTLTIRSGELGFLQSWFGRPAERPGQYAASWSQRLIYTYVDGRIFVDHPVLGTGWWGNLPPSEFVRYLPDARRRYPDQPPRYFPPPDRDFVPQQTFDQLPAELGIVGAGVFLVFLAACARAAARTALSGAWLAASVGAIAGEALYGGTPLTASFFLVTGVALAAATRTRNLT